MVIEKNMGVVRWTDEQLETRVQEIIASLGGGGGFDLLWESPNDAMTSVNTQTITLDKPITGYTMIAVECRLTTSASTYSVVNMTSSEIHAVKVQTYSEGKGIYTRGFSFNYGGDPKVFYCGSCSLHNSLTTSGTTSSSFLIPYRIYGVK